MKTLTRRDAKVTEVAKALDMHPETVRILTRQGKLPNAYKGGSGKVNSPTLIPWSDVEDYKALLPRVCR
jgi:hypothetical protein